MGVLATDKRQLIYIYSEDSRLGKEVLSYIQGIDKALKVININKETISGTIWTEIASLLNLEVGELFSSDTTSSDPTRHKDEYSTEDWLKLIQHNPHFLQTPIAINGSKAKQIEQRNDLHSFYEAAGGDLDKSKEAIKKVNL